MVSQIMVKGGKGQIMVKGGKSQIMVKVGKGQIMVKGGKGQIMVKGGKGQIMVKGGKGQIMVKGGKGQIMVKGGKSQIMVKGGKGQIMVKGGKSQIMVKGGKGQTMVKGGQRRYQKRKAPPRREKVSVVNVVEDMVGKGSGTPVDEVVIEPPKQTISEAKIKEIPVPDNTGEFPAPTGYRFMDMSILDTVFSMVSCPQCYCISVNFIQNKKTRFILRLTVIGAIYFGHQRKDQNIIMSIVEYFIQCVVLTMVMLV